MIANITFYFQLFLRLLCDLRSILMLLFIHFFLVAVVAAAAINLSKTPSQFVPLFLNLEQQHKFKREDCV